MQIIASHTNTDFDALASMLAAKKLHPNAQIVISNRQHSSVRRFLNIYRDTFNYVLDHEIDWSKVTELILVDVSELNRVSPHTKKLPLDTVEITIYDHHESRRVSMEEDGGKVERVGAAVTLLIEEIIKKDIPINPFEATLFGLGIYTDTGFFTYSHTTARDLKAASFLMDKGLSLELVERFSEQRLEPEQQYLLDQLFLDTTTFERFGLQIALGTAQFDKVHSGLALVTEKLLDIKGTDATLVVVGMKNQVIVVGRASSERITLLPLLKKLGGGGHKHAASATIKDANREEILKKVKEGLDLIVKPATTAKEMMNSPVKTIPPDTRIEEAGALMYRYEHSGYPVVEDGDLVGIITRRDLDKAIHHGLGHAPVKAYMSTEVITAKPSATLEEIQNLVIEHNIGRLPIVEDKRIIGIISRTDIIKAMHESALLDDLGEIPTNNYKNNIRVEMKQQLSRDVFTLLKSIGKVADRKQVKAYLIGGIVRDILLKFNNDDIDIVVEGDGIQFAKELQQIYGGDLVTHGSFGTASWTTEEGIEIDIASSRLEFYERPASLPDVELSTLQADLYRRDFTINAMAVCLNEGNFGQLVDPFAGRVDIFSRRVRILHNLSFVEDPTRIFRAIRFELRFGFKMDDQTEMLAHHSIDQVQDLSTDRIISEMKRLFKEHYPTSVIRRLFELKFWQQFGVEADKIQASNAHAKRLHKLHKSQAKHGIQLEEPNWFSYFIIPFFHERDYKRAEAFALTRQDKKYVKEVFRLIDSLSFIEENLGKLHADLHQFSKEAICFLIAAKSTKESRILLEYVNKRSNLPIQIKGRDLQQLGLTPGPHFSNILLQLEMLMLNEEISTEAEAIAWVKENFL